MSDIKIQPSATGSATVTLTAPTTGTARTVTLPDDTGTLISSTHTGDLTLDVSGDIILDADGGDFKFKDNGTHILSIVNSSSDVIIKPIQDNKDVIFQQRDGTEVARVGNNGLFTINSGLAIGGTGSANTLDDYEEGTFTPLLKFSGATTGIVQSSNYTTGWYTKVGNLVNFGFILILSNKGSASGSAQITGLPFALNDVTYQQTTLSLSMENVSFADQHWAYMPRNQSVITLRESTNAGSGSNIADTNVASNSQFMCQGSYISG